MHYMHSIPVTQSMPEVRRAMLRSWIERHFDNSQTNFIAFCAERGYEINQGELSGLLKTKSFGEKKARTLEMQADMPPRYLDGPTHATFGQPIVASDTVSIMKRPSMDKWTKEALSIFAKLNESQKAACVVQLRAYLAAVGPPQHGQAL